MAARSHISHGSTLRYQPSAVQPPSYRLASVRLNALYGDAVSTWQDRISGERSWFVGLARVIRVLRDVGLSDRIPELMVPIDAALAPQALSLKDCIDAHNAGDALEDVAQSAFVKGAGDEDLECWIKKLAGEITSSERLLAGLEQERQKRREARQ